MQGITPLEIKYHLRDIERSFAACRTVTQAQESCEPAGQSWVGKILGWTRRPFTTTLKRSV